MTDVKKPVSLKRHWYDFLVLWHRVAEPVYGEGPEAYVSNKARIACDLRSYGAAEQFMRAADRAGLCNGFADYVDTIRANFRDKVYPAHYPHEIFVGLGMDGCAPFDDSLDALFADRNKTANLKRRAFVREELARLRSELLLDFDGVPDDLLLEWLGTLRYRHDTPCRTSGLCVTLSGSLLDYCKYRTGLATIKGADPYTPFDVGQSYFNRDCTHHMNPHRRAFISAEIDRVEAALRARNLEI